MTKRSTTIDAARGIGIILVVFGHNWIVTHERGELFRLVFSFHVPLFFFLAGIFLRSTDRIAPFAAARAGALLKPYFAVLLAFGLYKLSEAALQGPIDSSRLNYFAGVLYGTGVSLDWTPMWFLPHLFLASVVCLVVLRQLKTYTDARWAVPCLALALLVTGIYTAGFFHQQAVDFNPPIGWGNLPGLPWSLDLVPVTMALMLVGYLLGQPVQTMKLRWLPVVLVLAVFAGLHWGFDEAMDFNLRIYGDPLISTVQAAAGIYLTLALAVGVQRLAPLGKVMAYVGSGSLFILIFHGYLQDRTFGALTRHGGDRYASGALSLAAGVVVPLLMWELTKRQKWLAWLLLPRRLERRRLAAPALQA